MKKGKVKRIISHIGKYKSLLILSIVLSAIYVVLTLLIPRIAGRAIDCIAYYVRDPEPVGGMNSQLRDELVLLLISASAAALIQWIINIVNNSISYRILRDIRKEAFDHIQILDLSYIDRHSAGDLVSRIIADAEQFSDGLLMGFTQLFTGIATIIGALIFMIQVDLKAAVLVAAMTPISLFIARFISKHTHEMFVSQSRARGEQTAYINEMITNQKIVRAFSREKRQLETFDEINDRLTSYSQRAVFFSSLVNPSTRFVNNLIYAAVALAGAYLCTKQGGEAFTVGALTALLSYVNQYTKPFNEVSGVMTELQNSAAAASRLFDLIDEPAQIPEKPLALPAPRGDICFDSVDFSYVPEKPLIEGLKLDVKQGQKIAIVGPTGCGKTTLINLLMRFYDVSSGSISIDGTDIRNCTRSSLREGFGMVLQDTWLKSGTIKDNIRMGKPDATDEEIVEAAMAAHSHSFIRRLPEGYDTYISEDGGSLSQGQKQLLCITRVMLALPPMIILDEATSSIDTRTEIRINRGFDKLTQGRTSFIVAHRLSTIVSADMILVMKNGHIVEQGTHSELLAADGFYASLWHEMCS